MSLTTTVTTNLIDCFGSPFANACFKFTPTDPPYNINLSLAAANAKSAFTDVNGNITASLVPGNYNVLITSKIKADCNNTSSYNPPNTNFDISVPSASGVFNINTLQIIDPQNTNLTLLYLPVSSSDARYLSINSTASYAKTASYALNGNSSGGGLTTGSTYPITASWSNNTLFSFVDIAKGLTFKPSNNNTFNLPYIPLPPLISGSTYAVNYTNANDSFIVDLTASITYPANITQLGWQTFIYPQNGFPANNLTYLGTDDSQDGLPADFQLGLLSNVTIPLNVEILGSASIDNGDVNIKAGDLILNNNQNIWFNGKGHYPQMFWAGAHPPNGELILTSGGNLSFNAGYNNQGNNAVQLGSSGPAHEIWIFQYDDNPTDITHSLGYSKLVTFQTHVFYSGSNQFTTTNPGFRCEVFSTSSLNDNGIVFYAQSPVQSGPGDVQHPLIGGVKSAELHNAFWKFYFPIINTATGSIITGSLLGTASFATSASYAPGGSSFNGTSSIYGTSSWSNNSISASLAKTASYLLDNAGDNVLLNNGVTINSSGSNGILLNAVGGGLLFQDDTGDTIQFSNGIFMTTANDTFNVNGGINANVFGTITLKDTSAGENIILSAGKVTVSGSFSATGSLNGTSSYAISASYAPGGSSFNGTSSIYGTSSWANNALQLNDGASDTVIVSNGISLSDQYANIETLNSQGILMQSALGLPVKIIGGSTATIKDNAGAQIFISSSNVIISGSFSATGSLFGTASWATNSLTASSINFTPSTASFSISSSHAITSSYAISASYAPGGSAFNGTSSIFGTSSWSNNSLTASFVTASNIHGVLTSAITSSYLTDNLGDSISLTKPGITGFVTITDSNGDTIVLNDDVITLTGGAGGSLIVNSNGVNISGNDTSSTPVNPATPAVWMAISVNGTGYFVPLYQ